MSPLYRCLLLSLFVPAISAAVDWQWRTGRATNYGGAGDPWTIFDGSCWHSYLDPTVNKGWDVAALSDAVSDAAGSCGRCYEVACEPMHLTDGYGTGIDRTSVCYDSSQSVTLMITDTCPCNYPANEYSNKRWCCGDYYHFDMSSWTFEKLADRKYGVIGIRYREVPCDYCPTNEAQLPDGENPSAAVQEPPAGWTPDQDKRPSAKMCFKSSMERADADSSAGQQDSNPQQQQQQQDNSQQWQFSQDQSNSSDGSTDTGSTDQQQQQQQQQLPASSGLIQPGSMFNIGGLFGDSSLLNGWQDMSWQVRDSWTAKTPDGQDSYCGDLNGEGAIAFQGSTGLMMGKKELMFSVKVADGGRLPDVTVTMSSSSKGTCRTVDLRNVQGSQDKGDGWRSVSVPLVNLNWDMSSWQQQALDFNGCSSSIGAWDIDQIAFKNKWGSTQTLCVADVKAE